MMNSTNLRSDTSDCLPFRIFRSMNITMNWPTPTDPAWITLLVVYIIATPVMFVMNMLIIWVVLKKVNLRSDKPTVMLAALAFTDLLVSVTVQPMSIFVFERGSTAPCVILKIRIPITALTAMLTLSSLMMVSVERYFAVEYPFFHSKITIKYIVLSVTVIWMSVVVALLTGILIKPFVGLTALRAIFFVIMIADVLVSLYCAGTLQYRVRCYMKAIVKRLVTVASLEEATDEEKKKYKKRYQKYKQVMTVGIIILANFIMYCPGIIILILNIANQLNSTRGFGNIAVPLVVTFFNFQSILNPFIVLIRSSSIRKAIKEKLCKVFCCWSDRTLK